MVTSKIYYYFIIGKAVYELCRGKSNSSMGGEALERKEKKEES